MRKHEKMCLNWGVFPLLFLTACQTPAPSPTADLPKLDDIGSKQPAAAVASAGETSELGQPEYADSMGDGFCYDDIYATYLRKDFQSKLAAPKKSKAIQRRRHSANRAEAEASYYARKTLTGPTDPYFGGIPVVANERVEQWISYFKDQGRPTFIKWLVRAESFREVVAPVLAQEGLPSELFYLAMIESGFSNTAASTASATGTWQFMKGTAQLYKLKIDHWVDERRDPVKSTVAAARYLRDLYAQFGDWYLAMAAYNAGPGKVRRAIKEAGTRDFWTLAHTPYLKAETKNYVPKVLAALNLSFNAREQGFDVTQDEKHLLPGSSVELSQPISLEELSRLLDVPVAKLKYWNPEIVRDITPPRRGTSYALRLAEDLVAKFSFIKDKLSMIEVTDILMHKIRSGESLSTIARRYKISINKIKELNPHLNPKTLKIGNQLAIPIPGIVTKQPMTASTKQDMG